MLKQIRTQTVVFFSNIMKKHTTIMIKSVLDFEKLLKKHKRIIIIFGTPKCFACQKIMFRYPIFAYKTKKVKIILKFCDIEQNKSFKNIGINTTPILKYYKKGKLFKTIEGYDNVLFSLKNVKKLGK